MFELLSGSYYVLIIFLVVGVLLFIALRAIEKNLTPEEELESTFDNLFSITVRSLKPWLYFCILVLFGTYFLTFQETATKVRDALMLLLCTYQIITIATATSEFFVKKSKATGKHEQKLFFAFSRLLAIVVWIVGILFILSNFGVNITALLAGFGIGGIAIAFAFQSILKDFFSYVTILLDQPIKEGDIVEIEGREGTVRHIGIKTTRLKTAGGEEIVIANDTIATSNLKNYGTARKRRVSFTLFLEHQTTQTKLNKLPEQMKVLIDEIEGLVHKSTYIKSINAAGIELSTIYFVKNRNFTLHRETRTLLYSAIHKLLGKEKVTLVKADIVANQ